MVHITNEDFRKASLCLNKIESTEREIVGLEQLAKSKEVVIYSTDDFDLKITVHNTDVRDIIQVLIDKHKSVQEKCQKEFNEL